MKTFVYCPVCKTVHIGTPGLIAYCARPAALREKDGR